MTRVRVTAGRPAPQSESLTAGRRSVISEGVSEGGPASAAAGGVPGRVRVRTGCRPGTAGAPECIEINGLEDAVKLAVVCIVSCLKETMSPHRLPARYRWYSAVAPHRRSADCARPPHHERRVRLEASRRF